MLKLPREVSDEIYGYALGNETRSFRLALYRVFAYTKTNRLPIMTVDNPRGLPS